MLARYILGLERSNPGVPRDFLELVREIYKTHKKDFRMSLIQLNRSNMEIAFVRIFQGMFKDGKCNWGRIATLYAFTISIGSVLNKERAAGVTGHFVAENLTNWILDQGGWSRASPAYYYSWWLSVIAREIAQYSPYAACFLFSFVSWWNPGLK